jgi:hypothetical protein
MTVFLTVVIILATGYSYVREGLFTAMAMCINVLLAGLIAFNFYEPLAGYLEAQISFINGYEDLLSMVGIFLLTLGALRTLTNFLVPNVVEFPGYAQGVGGGLFGVATGYLVAGFVLCALQTLPWHENFMSFDWRYDSQTQGIRRLLPPDRVWLGLMYRAGAFAFATSDQDPNFKIPDDATVFERAYATHYTFDKYATFEMRYARFRRYNDSRDAETYQGQLADQLKGPGGN